MFPLFPEFRPAWWCRGPHLQTLAGALLRRYRPPAAVTERLELPDGDFLDLDVIRAPGTAPWVILLHGLEGSSRAPVVQSLAAHAAIRGWNAVLVNLRGCSGIPNRLPTAYHSGKSDDLEAVIAYILKRYSPKDLFLSGGSMGGNIMLKWAGERGDRLPEALRGIAALSVPYDLAASVRMLDSNLPGRVYTWNLLRTLRRKAAEKSRRHPGFLLPPEEIMRLRTFREFDREVTARLHGFRNEEDYWERSSSARFLDRIRVPSLLIHAADDPFLPAGYLPVEAIRKNPVLQLLLVPEGGHLGFYCGSRTKEKTWLESQVFSFFQNLREKIRP